LSTVSRFSPDLSSSLNASHEIPQRPERAKIEYSRPLTGVGGLDFHLKTKTIFTSVGGLDLHLKTNTTFTKPYVTDPRHNGMSLFLFPVEFNA
jgi:hypothetical protein